jgi:hypothetical protein
VGRKKEALGELTSASFYCINVNRTSLDHLLLGAGADIDESVDCAEYIARAAKCQAREVDGAR